MSGDKLRWFMLALALYSLFLYGPTPTLLQPAHDCAFLQISDESALRSLVEQYYAAYASKDADAMFRLWSAKSEALATRRKSVEEIFKSQNFIEVHNLNVLKVAVEGEKAEVSLTIETAASGANAQPAQPVKTSPVLQCVREDGMWRIWTETTAEEELAMELGALKTEEERATLLVSAKELVSGELVTALLKQGDINNKKGNYTQSLIFNRTALNVAEKIGDRVKIVSAFNALGELYSVQGDYPTAMDYDQKALALGQDIGDKRGGARALFNIGNVQWQRGDYQQAQDSFNKSIELYRAVGDKLGIAKGLNGLGIVNRWQGNYSRALDYYQKALALCEEIGDRAEMARLHNNLGVVNNALGNSEVALDYYRKSLAFYEEAGFKSRMAGTLSNISIVYRFQGNYRLALEHAQRALKLAEELKDKPNTASALKALSAVYGSQGEEDLALEYRQRYLALNEAMGNRAEVAYALFDIGTTYFKRGEYDTALEYQLKSMKLREQIGEKPALAESYMKIGDIYDAQGKRDLALEFYRKSLALEEAANNNRGLTTSFEALANFYYKQGNYKEALEAAESGARTARQAGLQEQFWETRTITGKAYRALNRPEDARKAFDEAIAVIESLRSQVAGGTREQQLSFERRVSPYLESAKLLATEKRASEALLYAERAKGRALLDVLLNGRDNITKAMTTEERNQERQLRDEISSLNAQISTERARAKPDNQLLSELDARLQQARLDFEAFQKSLYAAHPNLQAKRGEAALFTVEQASHILPDDKSALLEYLVTDEQTYLFVLTKERATGKDDLKLYTLDIKRDDLEKRVENYRAHLAGRNPDFSQSAQELYGLLLRPAQKQLQDKTKLIIVPDAGLWGLPFQALQPTEGRYVIEDQAVSYAPSLTVLREMMRLRRKNNEQSSASSLLLAFGNPKASEQTISSAKLVTRAGLEPLPDTEKEVRALEQLYGAAQSRIYVGAEAREDRIKLEAGKYRIIHLATHGILNNSSPLYSYLLLSRPNAVSSEDGLLEAWEIMQMDLRADMVILSACETARGRFGAGEGVIGLSWAFFVAGTPTTVVSQWKVESTSTNLLMTEFHRNLQSALKTSTPKISEADALRLAVLKLNKNELYRHPFYWAGFIVVGDGF